MIDDSLIPLLGCPWSRRSLVFDDDAEEIRHLNDDLAHGRLVLSSGERLAGPVEAVLRTVDAEFRYPVIGGIPFLLKESVLRKSEEGETYTEKPFALTDSQRQLMEKFSRIYDRWSGEITAGLQQILQERYYPRFEGCVVLDGGNGGTAPDVQLGAETARKVARFIALDNSFAMLTRNVTALRQIFLNAPRQAIDRGRIVNVRIDLRRQLTTITFQDFTLFVARIGEQTTARQFRILEIAVGALIGVIEDFLVRGLKIKGVADRFSYPPIFELCSPNVEDEGLHTGTALVREKLYP